MICELFDSSIPFCSYFAAFNEGVDVLFNALCQEDPVSPQIALHALRVISALMGRKKQIVFDGCRRVDGFVRKILRHADNKNVLQVFFGALLNCDFRKDDEKDFLEWALHEERLIDVLLEELNGDNPALAGRCLRELVQFSGNVLYLPLTSSYTLGDDQQTRLLWAFCSNRSPVMKELLSESVSDRLMQMIVSSASEGRVKVLRSVLDVVVEIITHIVFISSFTVKEAFADDNTVVVLQTRMSLESGVSLTDIVEPRRQLIEIGDWDLLRVMFDLGVLDTLDVLLRGSEPGETSPTNDQLDMLCARGLACGINQDPVRFTFGVLNPPFGSLRLRALEVFVGLGRLRCEAIADWFIEHDVVIRAFDLMCHYKWNCVLHSFVGDLIGTFAKSPIAKMRKAVLDGKIPDQIAECGIAYAADPLKGRMSSAYIGYMYLIANNFIEYSAVFPDVREYLTQCSVFQNFVSLVLEPHNQLLQRQLGGSMTVQTQLPTG